MSTATDAIRLDLSHQECELIQELLELAACESADDGLAWKGFSERMRGHEDVLCALAERLKSAAMPDVVDVASEDSFPASDAPGWTPVAHVGRQPQEDRE